MDWNAKSKFGNFIATIVLLIYWIVVTPWIWMYDKLKRRK